MNKKSYPKHLVLAISSLAGLAAAQILIWLYAPIEQSMGLVQKIFYLHLPLAWWALISFFLVFLASIAYLWKRRSTFDYLAGAAAEIGVLFSILALLTGSLWARSAWNTWWTWDPRLSTTLIMCFVYCAYLILRGSQIGGERRADLCAVLGIVAFLDVPLVFLSARLWRSIHPAVVASSSGGMEPEMWLTVIIAVLAWGGLFSLLLFYRWEQLKIRSRLDALVQW